MPSSINSLCTHHEGWGPLSPTRYDLTPCFEYSVLFGALSLLAALGFLLRIYYLRKYRVGHRLGRTFWIYWPTQIFMFISAVVSWMLYWNLSASGDISPAIAWSCFCMGTAWVFAVALNKYEHEYTIRSSSAIYAFYVAAISATLIITKTTLELAEPTGRSTISLLIALTLFLSAGFVVEAWPRGKTRVQRMSSAGLYAKANLGSRLFFTFYFPFIKIGLKRTITQDDILGQLPPWMETEVAYEKLSSLWADRLLRRKSRGEQPSLFQIILLSNWELLVPVLLSRVAIVLFSYTLPVILNELLSYLEDYESKPLSYGITLAIGIFVSSLFASLVNTYNRYQMILIGVRTRAALIAMIYRKALRLSAKARSESTNGEITNHMSVDADQWWDMFSFLSMWISIPLEIAIAMKLLYGLLGWTMLAGVLTMLAMLPVQTWQAKFFKSMQAEKLKAMDQRVQLTTEVLSSMKIIKLYGWSTAFINRILAVRSKELNILKRIGIVEAFMSIIFISSSLIISLVTFSVYALWGGPGFTPGKLTLQTVFVSMTLFSMLKNPISSLSDATASTLSVLVATKRIQRFFLLEEIDDKNIMRFDLLPRDPDDPLILIKDGTFSWIAPVDEGYEDNRVIDERSALLQDHGSSEPQLTLPPTLRSINLSFGRGKLTAIVGRVGQGKSSLLSAMIGELYKLQGKIQISGHVAYVPQQAWIINKTLKDNILFGKRYDEERYKQVIFACGLEPDLAVLPAGDMTEIGERGINLSGGQKQRVSLARAAYDDADIYLLDDPLSAVDAHVSHHLWNHLLGSTGLLRDKTRVLVTHGIHHLREVDQIVVLHEGMVAENGPYSELMANKKIFYRLIKEYSKLERRSSSTPKVAKTGIKGGDKTRIKPGNATISTNIPNDADDSGEATEGDESGDISDQSTSNNTTVAANNQEFKDDKKDTKAGIITVEAIKEGAVGYGVGILYAKAVSYLVSTMVVLLFVLAQICLVSTSLWLKHWINENKRRDENNPPSIVRFLGVYALLTLIYVLLYMIIMWLALAVGRIRASERIHYDFLNKIMHLPIAFFDTTPLGRIINRFSSDVGTVDVKLSSKLIGILLFGTSVMSTLILVVSTTPSFIFVAPLFMAAYYLALICFLSVNQILARIYAASKSPIYQHFNESLGGVSTLRAMKIQSRFVRENTDLTDRNSNNFLSNMGSRRWMDVQLRLLSTIIVFITALFAVLERERMDPSMVGLTLSFALSITEEVTSLVRMACDLQYQLVSLERILEYTNLKTEAPDTTDVPLPDGWPSKGRINFKNYSTRYREGLDLVIKNVTLEIAPTERVGIVGRTGAGKSSLTLALFRIVEAANSYWAKQSDNSMTLASDRSLPHNANGQGGSHSEEEAATEEEDGGRIEIDGVDISTVGLQDLRRHLSIIPQDPTLFVGTVRDNLDPFHEVEDADLWRALERSHLKDYISTLPGGLSFEVAQNGGNFSVGQRSLICLARALLRKSKILIMDEATAAVDVETDELIQKTIRQEFRDRTVLTIAHRIKTVMDSDKILVLERGRVLEFDTPSRLLKKEDSLFYKLAEQAGEV